VRTLACRVRQFYDALVQLSRPKWFAVLVCLLIGLFVLFSTRSRGDLLSRASRVAIAQGVITNELTYSGYRFFYHHVPSCFWLSDSELFSIHEVRRGVYESVRLDLAAGTVVREPGRGPVDASPGAGDRIFCWTVSPDGKWILSIGKASNDDLAYVARRFDATHQVGWTNRFDGGLQPTWLSDSSGFIEWCVREGVGYARVYWLDTGRTAEINLDALNPETPDARQGFREPHAPVDSKMWREGSAAEFIELTRHGDGATARRYRLRSPPRLARGEGQAFLSPRGDRLAWVVTFERRFPSVGFQRHDPYFVVEPAYSTVICLSRTDGSDVRVLGRLQSGRQLTRLAWTPDSARLSFVCDHALWTVAVN